MPNEENLHVDAKFQVPLPKPIIKPWEELVNNKHKTSLGYEKDVSFHIPDYTKPIQFYRAIFLQEGSYSLVPDPAPSYLQ